ncbi:hypothetical protein BC832DRAFT_595757 [Gaertneriomyces semiglobifer]|nr:hypothetical protein BC832DRAFT_595757 [Gaertneriomyces semiglobifer]
MSDDKRKQSSDDVSDPFEAVFDPGLEWVHCGRCHTSDHAIANPLSNAPSTNVPSESVFFLTNCAHITCETCMQQENPGIGVREAQDVLLVCPVCRMKAAALVIRNELVLMDCGLCDDVQIPDEVAKIFTPAVVHFEDAIKVYKASLPRTIMQYLCNNPPMQLQYANAVRLLRFLKLRTSEYSRKYKQAVKALRDEQDLTAKLRHDNDLLRRDLAKSRGDPSPPRINRTTKENASDSISPRTSSDRPLSSRSNANRPGIRTPRLPSRLSLRPASQGSDRGQAPPHQAQQQPPQQQPASYPYPPNSERDHRRSATPSSFRQPDQRYFEPTYTQPIHQHQQGYTDAAQYIPDTPIYGSAQQPSYYPANGGYDAIPPSPRPYQAPSYPFERAPTPMSIPRLATANSRSATAMRQPFQSTNIRRGSFVAPDNAQTISHGSWNGSGQSGRPASVKGMDASGRTLLQRNRSSFPGGNTYMR